DSIFKFYNPLGQLEKLATSSVSSLILGLVIACIIYWQAKETHRVIQTHVPPEHIDLKLLSHISPVSRDKIAICLLCAIGLLARQARAAGPPESASVPGLGGAMVPRRLPDRERNVLV
ncbi:MAG: hypothetical protein V3S24_17050, partial [Candidatus Tectomicrobia bacterium]